MKPIPTLHTLLFLLLAVTVSGCRDEVSGPLDGRWNGELIRQGTVVDIGTVEFGADFFEMSGGQLRHAPLTYRVEQDQIEIREQNDPRTLAQVRLIDPHNATMTLAGLDGYIELSRGG